MKHAARKFLSASSGDHPVVSSRDRKSGWEHERGISRQPAERNVRTATRLLRSRRRSRWGRENIPTLFVRVKAAPPPAAAGSPRHSRERLLPVADWLAA